MPTLGFLKKKRTREGNQDSQGSSLPTSPVTPTSSKPFDSSISTTLSSLSSNSQPPSLPALKQQEDLDLTSSSDGAKQQQMYPVTVHPPNQSGSHQPHYNQQGGSQQNLPSINNLINPTQHDGSNNGHTSNNNYLAQPTQPSQPNPSPGSDPARLQQQQAQSMLHPPQPPQHQQQQQQQSHQQQQQQQQQQHGMPQQVSDQQVRQTKGKYTLTDFDILRTLGTGSFGRVHLVQSKHNQRFYAVKVLKKAQVVKMKQVEHTNDERKMLGEVKHPFLITLWGTFQDSKNLYMVMDFVEGGELFSLLRKSGRFPNPVAKFYAAEVTLALEYMHSRNIIYRDLKPENLLLDRHGHLKITDFGFAKRVPDKTWTLCGTPDYLAPEVVSNKGYNKSVDWWSLGILIYEMLCGYTPFWDSGSPMKIYENILKGKVKYPAYINPDAQDLLEKLITADLTKRLGNLYAGPNDVKNHPWFTEVTWDRLARKDIDAPYTPPVKAGAGDASQFDRYPEDPERYGSAGHDEYGHLFTDF
ncbi:hypothetical protein CTAM01_05985 [Colletotrichum tamarilloi]|uniref:cAMP-dependent protein kinase n=1 Tax=Colletotrichum tamarilloi TaxID=1209934 RepID=A0ABQ9RD98_9PEZI|nr:uncharacterized protein CTAM01_05985 [Colletotrichum tamarilloi]KAI3539191.1 hypothetical protein CSPX01_09090 [Colletotrichum filicis]KAK1501260.1 hypothetical protein CTAM01_05985 [Colletotrichum tamarilloi]